MLIRDWRKANGLTIIEAAGLFGTNISSLSQVERGLAWPGPELMTRIVLVSGEIGPAPVVSGDILRVWRLAHSESNSLAMAHCRNVVARHQKAAGSKEGHNGKASKGEGQRARAKGKDAAQEGRRKEEGGRAKGRRWKESIGAGGGRP